LVGLIFSLSHGISGVAEVQVVTVALVSPSWNMRAVAKAMDLIRRDKERAMTLGMAHGLRGDIAIERKALDYYVDDLDIRLKQDNVAALLKQIEISEPPQKYFDETHLTRATAVR
jgi:hypothetical protein